MRNFPLDCAHLCPFVLSFLLGESWMQGFFSFSINALLFHNHSVPASFSGAQFQA